jgi:hypothetical protein
MIYLVIQSSLLLLDDNCKNLLNPIFKCILFYKLEYRIEAVKFTSPIIFFAAFNLPIMGGVGLGVLANHIAGN